MMQWRRCMMYVCIGYVCMYVCIGRLRSMQQALMCTSIYLSIYPSSSFSMYVWHWTSTSTTRSSTSTSIISSQPVQQRSRQLAMYMQESMQKSIVRKIDRCKYVSMVMVYYIHRQIDRCHRWTRLIAPHHNALAPLNDHHGRPYITMCVCVCVAPSRPSRLFYYQAHTCATACLPTDTHGSV